MVSSPPDWKLVDEATVRVILGQGEKHLSAQMQAGLAADQRAMTATTIFIGFATAIFGASISVWLDKPLAIAGLAAGTAMLAGAAMCSYAARPTDFYFPGNHPERWWSHTSLTLSELLGVESENYQDMIDENSEVLDYNAEWLTSGVVLASLSPVLFLISWLYLSWISSLAVAYPAHP